MTAPGVKELKRKGKKISMVTCYDYTSAKIVADTEIDMILVGDSLAMTMYGHKTTTPATVEIMAIHTEAVARAAPKKLIIGDMPFLSTRKGLAQTMDAVEKLIHAGAQAVKFEGHDEDTDMARHIVNSGVAVMGHIGMTPQFIHQFGGFKVQGKTEAEGERILKQAIALEESGCFAIVLECVPADLAKRITERLSIPTIGIGAGAHTDGQVLVWQDLLGMDPTFQPKFVKRYCNAYELFKGALDAYDKEVKLGIFPQQEHTY